MGGSRRFPASVHNPHAIHPRGTLPWEASALLWLDRGSWFRIRRTHLPHKGCVSASFTHQRCGPLQPTGTAKSVEILINLCRLSPKPAPSGTNREVQLTFSDPRTRYAGGLPVPHLTDALCGTRHVLSQGRRRVFRPGAPGDLWRRPRSDLAHGDGKGLLQSKIWCTAWPRRHDPHAPAPTHP